MYDEEILKEFIIESREHLSELEEYLNLLVDDPKNGEYLNQLFRAIHSIKGSADYLGLSKTGEFLHSFESVLERVRQGKLEITGEIIDILFLGMDTVASLLMSLAEKKEEAVDTEGAISRIKSILEMGGGEVEAKEPEVEAPVFEEFDLEEPEAEEVEMEEPKVEPLEAEELDVEGSREPERLASDIFKDEIGDIMRRHLTDLENALKDLEKNKSIEELQRFLDIVSSFSSSIEYFGYEELESALVGVRNSALVLFEEDENINDIELLSFYKALDHIKDFIEAEGILGDGEFSKIGKEEITERQPSMEKVINEFTIIPGLGFANAELLYDEGYRSLEDLSKAKIEDLEVIDGISLVVAKNIAAYFKEEVKEEGVDKGRVERRDVTYEEAVVSSPSDRVSDGVEKIRGEVREDIKVGYDTELIDIFLSATIDLFSILDVHMQNIKLMDVDEATMREVLEVVLKLKRSAHYMEYDVIVTQLDYVKSLIEKFLSDTDGFIKGDIDSLVGGLTDLKNALRRSKIMAKSDETAKVDLEELSEEDKELIQIFLSASEQYMETIGTCLANLKKGENVTESLEIYRKAIESLKSSAKFMGYESILDALNVQMGLLGGDSAEDVDGPALYTILGGHFKELKDKIYEIARSAGIPYAVDIPFEEPSDMPPVDSDDSDDIPSLDTEEVSGDTAPSDSGGGGLPPAGPPGDGGEPPSGDISYSRQTLRVETDRVDNIMNLVGELVVNRASFSQLINNFKEVYRDILDLKKLDKTELNSLRQLALFFEESTAELGRVSNELQEGVMRVRMVSINQLFTRFPRLVRDLAQKMNKDVKLVITGRETELDKSVIEEIGDPLTHIIRNAIAHGFETVEERRKIGKLKEGTLSISAYHQGNQVIIEITDDGMGIDINKIKEKMEENGEVSAAEVGRVTDREAINYLFRAGISMTDKISHVSGRGVGLDIVKKNIDKLKGSVDVVTQMGVGTSFVIKLPLTLAIIQALIVGISDKVFSIPLSAVTETVRISVDEVDSIEGHQVLRLRDKVLPLLRLSDIFKMNVSWEGDESDGDREIFIVILSAEDREIGLIVDKLIGEEDIVIKSLEEYLSNTRGISGASIMGDGTIALILDVVELVNLAIAKEKEVRGKQAEERYRRKKRMEGSRDNIPPR